MTHHTFYRTGLPRKLEDLGGFVSQVHIEGAKVVSEIFRKNGIKHSLVGGLAVGVNGYPHHTNDIDFMIDDSAFNFAGPLITLKHELPIRYKSVPVDWLVMDSSDHNLYDEYMVLPPQNVVPVIPIEGLVMMKLQRDLFKDKNDIVNMVKAGADVIKLRDAITKKIPNMIILFDQLIHIAELEL